MKITRRDFLKSAAIAGAGLALPLKFGVAQCLCSSQQPAARKVGSGQCAGLGPAGIPVLAGAADPVFAKYHLLPGHCRRIYRPVASGPGPNQVMGILGHYQPGKETPGRCHRCQPGHAARLRFTNTLPHAQYYSGGHNSAGSQPGAKPHRHPSARRRGSLDQRRRPV